MAGIVHGLLKRVLVRGRRSAAAREHARIWQEKWSATGFDARWGVRDIPSEIVESAANGWFPAGGSALDVGCGEGQITAWMAARGFPSVGVDIAPAAVARAQAHHPQEPGRLEFFAVDVCRERPPDRQYRVLIDRGCFHGLDERDYPALLSSLLGVCAPNARMLLIHRAFSKAHPTAEAAESQRAAARVTACFGSAFRLVRSADTFLDQFGGQNPDHAMKGVAFWMERR